MTAGTSYASGNFLPENIEIPTSSADLPSYLKLRLEEILRLLNRKDTGSYEEIEQIINQQFFGSTPQNKRFVFRRVYSFSAIGAGAFINIPHGITGVTNFTRIYGTTQNATDSRPLPYADAAAVANQVAVLVTSTDIVVTNGATAPAIVSGIVVLEFLKT